MLAHEVHSCLGFHIECGTLFKGAGVTVMAFILFVGSVYLMLSLVFGRWMGYLVLAVAFSGWMHHPVGALVLRVLGARARTRRPTRVRAARSRPGSSLAAGLDRARRAASPRSTSTRAASGEAADAGRLRPCNP